jgi:hypothetical protein
MSDDLERGLPDDPSVRAQTAALNTLAKSSESPEAYIAERQDMQSADEGEQPDPNARAERIYQALEQTRQADTEARQDAGLDPIEQLNDEYFRQYETISEAQRELEQEQQREADKAEARFTAHADILRQANPELHQHITSTLGQLDHMGLTDAQSDAIKAGLTGGDPQEGLAIAARLATPSYDNAGNLLRTPSQKMQDLAAMSPAELANTFQQARQYLQMERDIGARFAAQYRQQSAAPPPFRAPRGGAMPPRNLDALASKENVGDYVRYRKQMMSRERR